jgi:polysaccharide export outer membrane protein
MNIKTILKFTSAAALAGFAMLVFFVPEKSEPEHRIQIAQPVAEAIDDGAVRPAAVEMEIATASLKRLRKSKVRTADYQTAQNPNQAEGMILDSQVQLCQGIGCGCQGACSCGSVSTAGYVDSGPSFGYGGRTENMPGKAFKAVLGSDGFPGESRWARAKGQNWEQFGYGEYIGPFRTPHVPDYRIRINDQLEFVYLLTRRRSSEPYRLFVGDTIQISSSSSDTRLNQPNLQIMSDGTVSLPLVGLVRFAGKTIANIQRELNDRYSEYVKDPEIVVQVIEGDSPLQGLRDAVDARAGNGGQSRLATVSPDGTIQLPKIGSVPAIGLTLEEIEREINARYNLYYSGGVEVTSILIERAPRFIYVLGEVPQPGQIEMTGPTSVMQAIALAQGFNQGGNLRQVVVFRRDANWQLIATRLDLAAPLFGRSPNPADEIWLRDSDIVLIPKKPIQRLSEAVNLYLSTTIYSIFPQQGVAFNFDGFTAL